MKKYRKDLLYSIYDGQFDKELYTELNYMKMTLKIPGNFESYIKYC